MQIIVLFVTLVVLWLLLSGLYLPLMLFLGLASCLLVIVLVRRFETLDHESVPVHLGVGIFAYWAWLLKEIVISSWQVTAIILAKKMPISPTMVTVQSKGRGEVREVLFGNSITLTPGTLTTDIDENGVVTVHALTAAGAEGVVSGDMNDRVARLRGKGER
jgi:multicomponent Na+:H+ antiporter subunit E